MTCAAVPTGDDASLAAALSAIDCQVDSTVAGAFARFFAVGGAMNAALTALLTIYVGGIAIGLMTGRSRLSLHAMTPRLLSLCLVLTFATSWPAYHVVVHRLLTDGPDQIAGLLMGAHGSAAQAFATRLDVLFSRVVEAGQTLAEQQQVAPANLRVANQLIWFSGGALLLSTAGLLIVTRILLAMLLAVGPLFVALALFERTRGLFEGWLRMAVAFALAPILIIGGGGAVIVMLSPLIEEIAQDPASAATNLKPFAMLALGACIYVFLVAAAGWTAFGLTRGWRLSVSPPAPRETPPPFPARAAPQTQIIVAQSPEERSAQALAAFLVRDQGPAHTAQPALLRAERNPQALLGRRIAGGQSQRKPAS